jgi:hypothetical protein
LAGPAQAQAILSLKVPVRRPFGSRRARFLLLGMAAAFVVTGLLHSYARWKPARVIVIPATADGGSVIT